MRINGGRLTAVAFIVGLMASGCATGQWSAPDALVRRGSSVFFAVSRREVHGSAHSWKRGGSIPTTEVTATRFRAVDTRTCRTVRTVEVPGEARVIAWDGDGDDLWFITPADPGVGSDSALAHSLSGATIPIPPGAGSLVGGTPKRPVRVSADATNGLLHIWDIHARVVSSLPQRSGPITVLADDTRIVAALPGAVSDTTTLVVIPRTPGVNVTKASQMQLAIGGLLPGHGWLLDDAVAYQTATDLVTFDLRSGAQRRTLSLPKDGRWAMIDRAHPMLVSLAPANASGSAPCAGALETVDVATGTRRQLVLPSCVTNLGPTSDEETPTLLLRGSLDGHDTYWAMQTRAGSVAVPLGLLTVPHIEVVGSLVFHAEGQVGARSLMVADVATGARRAATAPLPSIDAFYAEPTSDSIIIKTAAGLLAYRIGAAKIDACDGD